MNKQTKMAYLTVALAAVLSGCKKSDRLQPDPQIVPKATRMLVVASASDIGMIGPLSVQSGETVAFTATGETSTVAIASITDYASVSVEGITARLEKTSFFKNGVAGSFNFRLTNTSSVAKTVKLTFSVLVADENASPRISGKDLSCIVTIGPAKTVPPGPNGELPIYQYQLHSGVDFLYSLSNDVINPAWSGWVYEGAAFYAFSSAINGAVPVYEYRHHGMTRNIYSTTQNLIQPNWPGWTSGVIVFYAFKQNTTPGTVPVYEFYNQTNESNLYSADINATNGFPGWQRLGIAFYAYPKK